MSFGIMPFGIMTFCIISFSIVIFSITIYRIMTFSIVTLRDYKNATFYITFFLSVKVLSVYMVNAVAP
jgi:hypothetical protein